MGLIVKDPRQSQQGVSSQFRLGAGLLLAQIPQSLAHEAVGVQCLNIFLSWFEPQRHSVPEDRARLGAGCSERGRKLAVARQVARPRQAHVKDIAVAYRS